MLKSKDEIGTSYILFMGQKSVHVVFRLSLFANDRLSAGRDVT